jgi:hypothetical protein
MVRTLHASIDVVVAVRALLAVVVVVTGGRAHSLVAGRGGRTVCVGPAGNVIVPAHVVVEVTVIALGTAFVALAFAHGAHHAQLSAAHAQVACWAWLFGAAA